jgi:hypothetical protein
MKSKNASSMKEVPLSFSDGLLSAKLWQTRDTKGKVRFVVGVPELGLSCFGTSDTEASFRLFSALVKYYSQLKSHKDKLGDKGLGHLSILTKWMNGIEDRMNSRSAQHPLEGRLVGLSSRRSR